MQASRCLEKNCALVSPVQLLLAYANTFSIRAKPSPAQLRTCDESGVPSVLECNAGQLVVVTASARILSHERPGLL